MYNTTQHKQYTTLLTLLKAQANVFLLGPAGSGKSFAAKAAAKDLGLPFYFNGAIDSEYKLLGFTDATGRIVSRPFREAFLNGGVYFFDELDASVPAATLAFNAALANAACDFPDGNFDAHENFLAVAAGNTFYGADHLYVGRNQQDAAFLDRFAVLVWDYDEALERTLAAQIGLDAALREAWVNMILRCRKKAAEANLHVVISPRATLGGLRCLKAGLSWEEAIEVWVRKSLAEEDWALLREQTHRENPPAAVQETKTPFEQFFYIQQKLTSAEYFRQACIRLQLNLSTLEPSSAKSIKHLLTELYTHQNGAINKDYVKRKLGYILTALRYKKAL